MLDLERYETVDLTSVIAPCYYKLHWDIVDNKYTYLLVKGGRGSGKSTDVSLEIPIGLTGDDKACAICFMKVQDKMKDAVFAQVWWGFQRLGLDSDWTYTVSPIKIVNKRTGQLIFFRGLDDPNKTKSIKLPKGMYFKYIWFEEADMLDDWENDVRKATQSLFRKDTDGDISKLTDNDFEESNINFTCFITYNPPKAPNHFLNQIASHPFANMGVYHFNYLDLPKALLTKEFITDAEQLKEMNEKAYRHEYLGEAVGVDGLTYPMFSRKHHVTKGLNPGERVCNIIVGIDEGSINDATACVPLMETTSGRCIVPLPFVYDPSLPQHDVLRHEDQAILICDYLMRLMNEFHYQDNLGFSGSIYGYIDSSEAGQQLGLCINAVADSKGLPILISPVPKKEIISDVKRVQGLMLIRDRFAIINGDYLSPLTNEVITHENMLITDVENMINDEKTGKPQDGNDHCENALRYATYLLKQQGGC